MGVGGLTPGSHVSTCLLSTFWEGVDGLLVGLGGGGVVVTADV